MPDAVLVVGAGPTGLTAALELSRLGVAVRLIDKRVAPATTSRAIGVQARTLELLDQRGLADALIGLGNPGHFGSIYGGGKRILHIDFSHVASRYPYILFVSQVGTERVLREACARYGVAPEWGTELIAIQQDALSHAASPASVVLRRPDGALERMATPWLIAAEGAHSLVRTTLGLAYEGHTRKEHYALGDLLVESDLGDTDFHIFSSAHGLMALFPLGGAHFRLIASTPPDEGSQAAEPSLQELQHIYDQRSSIPARFHDLIWSSWFRINSRMVPRLKIGRLFLGGDAAHVHSPAGAQGMNTGMQDMINLSWKLAMVMQGRASADLLDTYEADRLPIMRKVLSRTDNLTTMIGTGNTLVRTAFNHLGAFVGGAEIVQENATANISQIALGYRDSPLSEAHGQAGLLPAGDRVPDLPVRLRTTGGWTETNLHRALDPSGFTLVVATPDTTSVPVGAELSAGSERLVEVAPPVGETSRFKAVFSRAGGVILVRPDGYAGLVIPLATAARHLTAYRRRWFRAA